MVKKQLPEETVEWKKREALMVLARRLENAFNNGTGARLNREELNLLFIEANLAYYADSDWQK